MKTWKSLFSLFLALAMIAGIAALPVSATAAEEAPMLEAELFGKVIPVDKGLGNELAYDNTYYYGQMESGRIWKEYIPEGMQKYKYVVMITVPDGWSTEDFLV